jgi:hypothetical protein
MIGDLLLPVYTVDGIGTIGTMNNRAILGANHKFHTIKFHTTDNTGELWHIKVRKGNLYTRSLWFYSDTLLFTKHGWLNAKEIGEIQTCIRTLKYRCLICNSWYTGQRPVWSVCGKKCKQIGASKGLVWMRFFNDKNIEFATKEDWVEVVSVQHRKKQFDEQRIVIDQIDGGDSIYVNNVLISSKEFANRV